MCFEERKTERRGRLFAARRSFDRTRCRRRRKRALAFSDIGLLLLAFLTADGLRRIFDPFPLVRLGRPIGADFGRDLADALTVGSAHSDKRRPLTCNLDIAWDLKGDLVAVAELQIERIALDCRAVANTADFKDGREAF